MKRIVALAFALCLTAHAAAFSGFGLIRERDLPTQAQATLALIRSGGPFPYQKDGAAFNNREGRLPARNRGYYREFTVTTPGSRDRGPRRIIAGSPGEYYYTEDHYRTFRRILE